MVREIAVDFAEELLHRAAETAEQLRRGGAGNAVAASAGFAPCLVAGDSATAAGTPAVADAIGLGPADSVAAAPARLANSGARGATATMVVLGFVVLGIAAMMLILALLPTLRKRREEVFTE